MTEQARRYDADIRRLLKRREEFMHTACPACGADRPHPAWSKHTLEYVECGACETVYMDPRPSPAVLEDYYTNSENYEYWNRVVFPASEGARREKIFRPRAQRLVDIARRHGTAMGSVVDVGAGFGTFCQEVTRLGAFERVVAVEPEPHLAATCRSKGIETVEARIEAAELAERVDVITSFEVIEHLFSPRDLVERCASLLPTGGLFVVTCPNVKGFDIQVLREKANAVDTEHLNYMHPESLGGLLELVGFDVIESQTPGRLDAELVRKKALAGEIDLSAQPFLDTVLLRDWDRLAEPFQDFLSDHGLSSNMWLVARRRA
jgi:SAM-dependent methyltransferase